MNGLGLQCLPPEIYDECQKTHREKDTQRKEIYTYFMKSFDKQRIGVCSSYEEYMKLAYGDKAPKVNGDPNLIADIRESGNLLYFLNTDGTVSILPGRASCVKIKNNPYYDEKDAKHEGLSLIFDHSLSTPEMRDYIIKNKLIPDAALNSAESVEAGRKLFQKNIRFFNDTPIGTRCRLWERYNLIVLVLSSVYSVFSWIFCKFAATKSIRYPFKYI